MRWSACGEAQAGQHFCCSQTLEYRFLSWKGQYDIYICFQTGQPGNPDIRCHGNKEGSETLIECISHGGRPAPKIKYILNNTFEEFPMTVNFNDLDKTFNAQSSFQRVFSRHDNKSPVDCCVEHELVKGKIKCTNSTLDIKCKYY